MVKRILITPGEPAGIGPELTVLSAFSSANSNSGAPKANEFELCALADPSLLKASATALGLPLALRIITPDTPPQCTSKGELACLPLQLKEKVQPGQLNRANAAYVLDCLQAANDMCLAKQAAAVVTGPVQKSVINDAGIAFSGHTEFFAEQSNTPKVVMMLATEGLRVALTTTHLPLRNIADSITPELLEEIITILHSEMQHKFGISSPKILVCGLNPHAGESGHLGREEIDVIIPVLDRLRQRGWQLEGPLPADTLFTPKYLNDADAVLAMYHDQGLPVLKYKGFGNAVNITLGLPYIRTSVDHGTALDLAGTGQADAGSMNVAIQYAKNMASTPIS